LTDGTLDAMSDTAAGPDSSASEPHAPGDPGDPGDHHARDGRDDRHDRHDLSDLRSRLAAFAAARDWGRHHTPKNLVMALSVEAGELLEIFQWLTAEEAAAAAADPTLRPRIEDEVADVLAYLLQFVAVCGIDPLAALAAKIDRNELRFPLSSR
jgi:NTP pyrophosphatase (non-canonical NTP hydrolase)